MALSRSTGGREGAGALFQTLLARMGGKCWISLPEAPVLPLTLVDALAPEIHCRVLQGFPKHSSEPLVGVFGETLQNPARDALTCTYCGGQADTVDHVRPRAFGGGDDPGNLVDSCRSCNSRKGTLPAELVGADWRAIRDYLTSRGWTPIAGTGKNSSWRSPDPGLRHRFYTRAAAIREAAWGNPPDPAQPATYPPPASGMNHTTTPPLRSRPYPNPDEPEGTPMTTDLPDADDYTIPSTWIYLVVDPRGGPVQSFPRERAYEYAANTGGVVARVPAVSNNRDDARWPR